MIKFRNFYNHDKEELFLNNMSINGYSFIKYQWGLYYFEECEPGEWLYKIALIDETDYLNDGSTIIDSWGYWVYTRNKAVNGPCDEIKNYEKRISYYKRRTLFSLLFVVFFGMLLAIFIKEYVSSLKIFWMVGTIIVGVLLGLAIFNSCKMIENGVKYKVEQQLLAEEGEENGIKS